QASELRARGQAASLMENAQATAQVNDLFAKIWQEAGANASDLFYLQQIEMVLKEATKIPARIKLDNVKIIDAGNGQGMAGLVNIYPQILRQFLNSVNDTLGVDVVGNMADQNKSKSDAE
ncbi:MAG: flotillin family protein, partial [Microcoleaceae cyanobacterium]